MARKTKKLAAQFGALDVRLVDAAGNHVKRGTVVVEARGTRLLVPQDPTTRNFRLQALTPGRYRLRGFPAMVKIRQLNNDRGTKFLSRASVVRFANAYFVDQ
jgi:predicted metalloprotease